VNRVQSSPTLSRRRRAPPSMDCRGRRVACEFTGFAARTAATTASLFSKQIVTRFFQDFLYFTEAPMRNIAALSST
jgi:hypothetical protein